MKSTSHLSSNLYGHWIHVYLFLFIVYSAVIWLAWQGEKNSDIISKRFMHSTQNALYFGGGIMADSGELVVMWIDSDSWKNGVETISKTLINLSWYNDRAPQIHFNRLKNYYKLSRPHGLSLPAKCFARESKYLPMGHTRTLVIHCKSPRILWDIKTATMNPDPRECNIKVFARFRPQSDAEIRAGGQNVVSSPTSDTCVHGVSPMMFLL